MSGAAAWLLLAGMVGVPSALLLAGGGLHRRPPRVRAAFRGAALGFLLAVLVVLVALVLPPLRWPPPTAVRLLMVAWALPVAACGGAIAGALRHAWRGPADEERSKVQGVDQGAARRVS